MQVNSIQQSQPSFNGYIKPNVRKLVTNTVKGLIKEEVQTADRLQKKVNMEKLFSLKETGKYILVKFDGFISQTHKDTFLDFSESGYFYIGNNNAKRHLYFSNNPVLPNDSKKGLIRSNTIFIDAPRRSVTLNELNTFASDLLNFCRQRKIDEQIAILSKDSLLGNFSIGKTAGIIKKYFARKRADKLDKYASDFGLELNARLDLDNKLANITNAHKSKDYYKRYNEQAQREMLKDL